MMKQVDALVIGGGVVGSAILHQLSSYDWRVALVEKEPDLCEGTSKANSALLHTGFDEPANTIESNCLIRSQALWPRILKNHNLAYEIRGAVMVAFTEEDKRVIEEQYMENARLVGIDVRWMTREEVLENNPDVNSDCIGGMFIEQEGIVDPFEATYSYAEVAKNNGADIMLSSQVTDITAADNGFVVDLKDGTQILTSYIINAAGLYSDNIAQMIDDHSFHIQPRKGQFIVTQSHVDIKNIILPVPSPISKGKLVTPAVFGGHLLGPTAEDLTDKEDKSTTARGLQEIMEGCTKLIPRANTFKTVRQYAGLRAVGSESDYILRPSKQNNRMIHVAGIRSTGLSASPGIAEKVIEELESVGANLKKKINWEPSLLKRQPTEVETTEEVICLCKFITKKDIVNTLNRTVMPTTLDGIKRRTEALLGDCQGACCIPKIIDCMEEQQMLHDIPIKSGHGSEVSVKS